MSLLRKQVEPWGVRTYVFENGLKRVTADVTRLKNAIAARDAVAVLELYLEPLAPGMGLDAVLLVREQLREEVVGLLEGAAAEADGERAEAYLARILELEPLHERALQGLLGHLLQRGRRRDAHKRYRSFARLLEEEMGLEPLPETRELLREPGTA
ncbi:MAG: bacterial transcriptional activator domain-containing protein, partial [Trueperaceae bacterium]